MGSRNCYVSSRLLQVQSVDLPEDVRARPRVPPPFDGELVSELPDRARERAGHRRHLLAMRVRRGRPRARTVVFSHHRVRRRALEGARDAQRLARKGRRDAAELDRAIRRRARAVFSRRLRCARRSVHDAHRHDLRRQFHRARARASAGGAVCRRITRSGRVPRESARVPIPGPRRADGRQRGIRHGPACDQPVHEAAGSDLGGELRPRRVRHRRDHGRPWPRSARLRVCEVVRLADHRRHSA